MKHTRSSAEVEIREAVVARFRQLWPEARIIHEMNVDKGSCRADVVAVTDRKLVICEIKSARDTLDRLFEQCRRFGPACHTLIVAADAKWCARPPMGESWRCAGAVSSCGNIPKPPSQFRAWRTWQDQRPWASHMLALLWGDELRSECARHRIACTSREFAEADAPIGRESSDVAPLQEALL